jgi:hypothetical protein
MLDLVGALWCNFVRKTIAMAPWEVALLACAVVSFASSSTVTWAGSHLQHQPRATAEHVHASVAKVPAAAGGGASTVADIGHGRRLTQQCAPLTTLSGNGSFTDGTTPGEPYGTQFDCWWVLTAQPVGYRVYFEFVSFNVEYEKNCDWDSVDVFDGVESGMDPTGTTGTNTLLQR